MVAFSFAATISKTSLSRTMCLLKKTNRCHALLAIIDLCVQGLTNHIAMVKILLDMFVFNCILDNISDQIPSNAGCEIQRINTCNGAGRQVRNVGFYGKGRGTVCVIDVNCIYNNARFSGFQPRLPIARLLQSLRAKESLKALFVRGMTSVLVIDIGIPIQTLNLTNSRLYFVVTIFLDPFCSGEYPTCQRAVPLGRPKHTFHMWSGWLIY